MGHSVIFHYSAIFCLIGADDSEDAIPQHLRTVDRFSLLCVILTFFLYTIFWYAKSNLSVATPPSVGLLRVILECLDFVAEKSRRLCPRMGNQGLCRRKFQLEFVTSEPFELLLDFSRFLSWA